MWRHWLAEGVGVGQRPRREALPISESKRKVSNRVDPDNTDDAENEHSEPRPAHRPAARAPSSRIRGIMRGRRRMPSKSVSSDFIWEFDGGCETLRNNVGGGGKNCKKGIKKSNIPLRHSVSFCK
jgi:hypothetical protein